MPIEEFYKLDFRNVNIRDDVTNRILCDQFQRWRDQSWRKMASENMFRIWRENEYYYEGYQVPIAVTGDGNDQFYTRINGSPLSEWVANNFDTRIIDTSKFRVKKNNKNQIYFVDNKIGPVIDRMHGDLTNAKKLFHVEADDDPTNDAIEKMVQNYLSHFAEKKNVWENVVRPSIFRMLILGLYWAKRYYDPTINALAGGDISFKAYHPKDVMIDPLCTEPYFLDARYVMPRIRLEINEARQYLKAMGVPNVDQRIMPDTEESDEMSRDPEIDSQEDFVTIYFPEFRMEYIEEQALPEMEGFQERQDIQQSGGMGLRKRSMQYFSAVWLPSLHDAGIVHYEVNPYVDTSQIDQWQFSITPFYDKHNSARLFPSATIEKVKNLQDIVNITKSLILNNARETNVVRAMVSTRLRAKNPELWDNFIRFGGQFDVDMHSLGGQQGVEDIRKHYQELKINPIDPSIYQFLQIAEQSIKDQTVYHDSLEGEYPKDKLSGVAIQRLQERNQAAHMTKPQNIEWAISTMAKGIYEVIAREFTGEHWAKLGGEKKIPINTVMTMAEFAQFLQRYYPGMDVEIATTEFEKSNVVDVIYQKVNPMGNMDAVSVASDGSLVCVNYLKPPNEALGVYHLGVRVTLDTEDERKKLEEKIIASELLQAGKFPLEMFLELQGGIFKNEKDRVIRLLGEENQVQQLAQMIADKGPEFIQAFQQFAAQWDAMRKAVGNNQAVIQ